LAATPFTVSPMMVMVLPIALSAWASSAFFCVEAACAAWMSRARDLRPRVRVRSASRRRRRRGRSRSRPRHRPAPLSPTPAWRWSAPCSPRPDRRRNVAEEVAGAGRRLRVELRLQARVGPQLRRRPAGELRRKVGLQVQLVELVWNSPRRASNSAWVSCWSAAVPAGTSRPRSRPSAARTQGRCGRARPARSWSRAPAGARGCRGGRRWPLRRSASSSARRAARCALMPGRDAGPQLPRSAAWPGKVDGHLADQAPSASEDGSPTRAVLEGGGEPAGVDVRRVDLIGAVLAAAKQLAGQRRGPGASDSTRQRTARSAREALGRGPPPCLVYRSRLVPVN
jgi:hypothetical protein